MKKEKIKEILANVNLIRSIPLILAYIFMKKDKIKEDIKKFMKYRDGNLHLGWSNIKALNYLLVCYPEFRNVYYYRLSEQYLILSLLLKIFYPSINDLYISAISIDKGLVIFHGFSTIIYAKSIGKNCTIYQQVTIGKTNDIPTIGDNVTIAAGAIIIGGINIGNNATIGAGAVVSKDIPENCVVIGNPAYIIRRNNIKVRQKL